ncbi:ATP-binding protein [Gynuella sp.]|uniref:ATP-binding protein n=1 Tax=Gynuella sp. TaxID=2969146 RepID=UPI003D0BB201
MRLNSLRSRLLVATLAVTVTFTPLTGFALHKAFRSSLEAGVSEQLQLQIYNLLAEAVLKDNRLEIPFSLRDERLNNPQSGLFAFASTQRKLQWKSGSTRWGKELETFLELPSLESGASESGEWRLGKEKYFYRRFQVVWEDSEQQEIPIQFTVMQTQVPFQAQLKTFTKLLRIWLLALVFGLILAWIAILRWGLQPMRRLAVELRRVEAGKQQQLSGDYPDEIQPITYNLNRVLEAEQDQRERYQKTLADLAHSLKTPLAVMKAAPTHEDLVEQVERMDQIIGYQLNRAVVSKKTGFVGKPCLLLENAERLTKALSRVYPDVHIDTSAVRPDYQMRMDEKDLLEILGNLMENACKYGHGEVRLVAAENEFRIEDNGPGISENERLQVLQRGVRLDSLQRGQGIGMAVVADIISSYDYELIIDDSELGGASFIVRY